MINLADEAMTIKLDYDLPSTRRWNPAIAAHPAANPT